MSLNEIAAKCGMTSMGVWYVMHNKNKTSNIMLAKLVAKETGKPPVFYLSDSIKELALAAHPDLGKKQR